MKAKKLLFTALVSMFLFSTAGKGVNAAEETSTADKVTVQETVEIEDVSNETIDDTETEVMEDADVNEDIENSELEDIEETSEELEIESKEETTKETKETTKTTKTEDKKVTKTAKAETTKTAKTTKTTKTTTTKSYTNAELRLLACVVFTEAGNQSYAGKLAVANVVLNRVDNKNFPNTMKGVIYQRSQFSVARNGMLDRAMSTYDAGNFTSKNHKDSIKAAKAALEGENNIGNYLYFTGYRSSFLKTYPSGKKIGDHYFR